MVNAVPSVGVILFNHSDVDFHVKAGDRIAQLILEKIAIADVEEVDGELPTTSVLNVHSFPLARFIATSRLSATMSVCFSPSICFSLLIPLCSDRAALVCFVCACGPLSF